MSSRHLATIAMVLIGERDLSQAVGWPRQYEHRELATAKQRIGTGHRHEGVVGNPHVGAKNVERLLGGRYRPLMSAPTRP